MTDSHLSDEERKRLRDVEQGVAVVRDRTHQAKNEQASNAALAALLSSLSAKVDALANKPEPPKAADTPLWLKVAGAGLAACVAAAILLGMVVAWGRSGAELTARVQAIETWRTENASVPARLQALETGTETARRIRDQQQQGISDRLVGLERSDVADRDRLNTVLQTLATITAQLQAQAARVEELLRRQDRLENRLGARGGSAEPEQPTGLHTWSLVYRPH